MAFMALFIAAAFVTLLTIIRYKKQTKNSIGVVFLLMPAPIIEAVGFAVRVAAAKNATNHGLFIGNMVLLGTAPMFLTIASWFVFPALIYHAGAEYSWMRPRVMGVQACVWLIVALHLNFRGMPNPRFGFANPSGLITAYVEVEDGAYVGEGGGLMLGGAGLVLGIEIISAILFAIFVRRFFAVNSPRENRRIALLCVLVAINIIAISVYLSH